MADSKITDLTALTGANLATGDHLVVVDVSDTTMAASGTTKRITMDEARFGIGGSVYAALTSNHANSTVTPTEATALSKTLAAGTYVFRYYVAYQTAATTTGIRLSVNFTGTVTRFVAFQYWSDVATSATATQTRAPVQNNSGGTTGGIMNSIGARAVSTAGWGTSISVDTINSDMLTVIEGVLVNSTSGSLALWMGSEIAASAATLMPGTSVVITRTA